MIPLTLAFMALSALAVLYRVATASTLDAALTLALGIALGFTAGLLYAVGRAR